MIIIKINNEIAAAIIDKIKPIFALLFDFKSNVFLPKALQIIPSMAIKDADKGTQHKLIEIIPIIKPIIANTFHTTGPVD